MILVACPSNLPLVTDKQLNDQGCYGLYMGYGPQWSSGRHFVDTGAIEGHLDQYKLMYSKRRIYFDMLSNLLQGVKWATTDQEQLRNTKHNLLKYFE